MYNYREAVKEDVRNSERIMLKVGSLYKFRDHEGYVLEVLRTIPDDWYSPFSARVRSIVT